MTARRRTPSAQSGSAVDVWTARDAGAEIAEKVAVGANAAQRIASSVALTAKIKSKMALDDTIKASQIDVDTAEGVVRLNGTVDSEAQRDRAVQLARETDGVRLGRGRADDSLDDVQLNTGAGNSTPPNSR